MIAPTFFPEDICHFFTDEKMGQNVLSDNEKELAQKYGTKRLTDFCTGRYCLRKCMEQYGFSGDILIGEMGMPLLPGHITASLSHSKKLSGAIAAHKDKFLSLGLDIETSGRVKKEMWRLLFTKDEIDFLNNLDDDQQNLFSTVYFSLKEAFYKLQYPITGIFLDFHDVSVNFIEDRYYVKTLRSVAGIFTEGELTRGYILELDNEVVTYCSLQKE